MSRSAARTIVAASALLAAAIAPLAPVATSAATCQSWVVQPPNVGSSTNWLRGVTVLSACDAWAVGQYDAGGGTTGTLIERWNGTAWKIASSPSPGTMQSQLEDVAAISPTDVWAVGDSESGGAFSTLVEHWNGRAWKVVSSPSPSPSPGTGSELSGIVAFSRSNVWAVGNRSAANTRTLVEHWNGHVWKVVPSPNVGPGENTLQAVDGTSPTNVWAVGHRIPTSPDRTLVEHWDGHTWKVQPSPNASSNDFLLSVSAISSMDAWAVGIREGPGDVDRTLIIHWNGHAWKVVPSPNIVPGDDRLDGIAMTSGTNGWVVGTLSVGPIARALIERWNGHVWKIESGSSAGTTGQLLAVAGVSSVSAWAVGFSDGTPERALALHCC